MNTPEQSALGKPSAYTDHYDATLLFPIPRDEKRREIGVGAQPVFFGADLWTAFELSWLNPRGKPQVAIAHFTVPCETPHIIESKSFKLYLGSFTNTAFVDAAQVRERLRADLNEALWRGAPAVGAGVGVRLLLPESFDREPLHELDGLSLDRLDIECTRYTPAPELLRCATFPTSSWVLYTLFRKVGNATKLSTGSSISTAASTPACFHCRWRNTSHKIARPPKA